MKTTPAAAFFALLAIGLIFRTPCAQGLEIKTSDGLTLELDAQSGRIEAVRIGDEKLAQRASVHPLRVRQFDTAEARNLVPNPGFEEGDVAVRSWRAGKGTSRVERVAAKARNR